MSRLLLFWMLSLLSLPGMAQVAGPTQFGTVKVGVGLAVTSGVLSVTGSPATGFLSNQWLKSNADAVSRLYFGSSSTTYFGTAGKYVFRAPSDASDLFTVFASGNVSIKNAPPNDTQADPGVKLLVDGNTSINGLVTATNTPIAAAPGVGWQLLQTPEGNVDWVDEMSLPSLMNVTTTGGWYMANDVGNGKDATAALNPAGDDWSFRIVPNGAVSDGFYFRTPGHIRTAPGKRLSLIGIIAYTGTMDASNGLTAGIGFVNGDDASGQSTPPAGGNALCIHLDRDGSGVPGLYAFSMKSGTINKVLLRTVTTGTQYTCVITLNLNGSVTYQVMGSTAYTESSATYLPANTVKLAAGGYCRRSAGGNTMGLNLYSLHLYRRYN